MYSTCRRPPCGLAHPPSVIPGTRCRMRRRNSYACSTHRGVSSLLSPPSTTNEVKPSVYERWANSKQYSSECFVVRIGMICERSPSAPRLIVTCRKLGSSRRPMAPSVRKTNRPSEVIFRMSRLLSIHASTLCSNGRSIRGGHISTLRRNFWEPCNALRSDMEGESTRGDVDPIPGGQLLPSLSWIRSSWLFSARPSLLCCNSQALSPVPLPLAGAGGQAKQSLQTRRN